MNTIMFPDELLTFIDNNLNPKVFEKKQNGEVFTPISVVNEMLDKLEEHNKSVFTDSSLKWLDPACGIGNFPVIVYMRLMEGLKSTIKNDEKRRKHILENMLYMSELNPKNVITAKMIFCSTAYKLNLHEGDSLTLDTKKVWGVEKFSVVMGNPPFQSPKRETTGTTAGSGTLWDKFVVKSLEKLNAKGFLCFITPPTWRRPEHKLYSLMTQENQLLYLHIIDKKQGQQLFSVSQRIDLYIIEKTPKCKNTEIIDELNNNLELDLSMWSFLPNYDYKNIKKIMTTKDNGIDVIFNTIYHSSKNMEKTKMEATTQYKFPVVHGITLKGIKLIYSKDNTNGHFGVPKVILNANEQQYPVNDYEGEYGMSQLSFGIPITSKKQGDDIVKAINTDEFKMIIKATKWGAFQTDYRMFKYFQPDFWKQFQN